MCGRQYILKRDQYHLVQMTSPVVSIYCQSIPGQELWKAPQSWTRIVGIIYMAGRAEVEVGEGHCTLESLRVRMCASWTLITWRSPLSDVILMTQPSIVSPPWIPKESSLKLPPSLLRVGFSESSKHHTPMLSTTTQKQPSQSHNY